MPMNVSDHGDICRPYKIPYLSRPMISLFSHLYTMESVVNVVLVFGCFWFVDVGVLRGSTPNTCPVLSSVRGKPVKGGFTEAARFSLYDIAESEPPIFLAKISVQST